MFFTDQGDKMILQDTEYDTMKMSISISKNIYDVLVSLYEIIDDENFPSYEINYAEEVEKSDDLFEEINLRIEEVVYCDIGLETFKNSILRMLTKENARLNAIYILLKFDHILAEREEYPLFQMKKKLSLNVLVKVGALNNNSNKYRFYLMSNNSLTEMSRVIKESNMRVMNRTSGYSIFYRIKSYRIIDTALPEIIINSYQNDYFKKKLSDTKCTIKIAVIPVANERWYDVHYTKNSKTNFNYFEITDKDERIKSINDSYINILDELNKNNVEIAVFPELAMNSKTEEAIKNYLIKSSVSNPQNHSIRLVFCGSIWKKQENECTLLSGSGSVLLRNLKRNPFEIKKDGVKYKERLKAIASVYNMIDIMGLGRIWYLVCKDGLDDMPQMHMKNEYGITFEMISCYSGSISYFEREAESFSQSYKGITVLANSCEPRINKDKINVGETIGFICVPAMRRVMPFTTTKKVEFYKIKEDCFQCRKHSSCAQVFTIYPNEDMEEEELNGMKIICDNIQRCY